MSGYPLFEKVTQRPLDEKPEDAAKCPSCNSEDLEKKSECATLVGWPGEGPDPNHRWYDYVCRACQNRFFRECKDDNVWYTKKKYVLLGMPNCFEEYIYQCKNCGGDVRQCHTALDGKSKVRCLTTEKIDGKWVKKYRTFYVCDGCSQGTEVEADYWPGGKG